MALKTADKIGNEKVITQTMPPPRNANGKLDSISASLASPKSSKAGDTPESKPEKSPSKH